jgi:hypothetical protein
MMARVRFVIGSLIFVRTPGLSVSLVEAVRVRDPWQHAPEGLSSKRGGA